MGLTGLIGLILLLVASATAVLCELSEKEDGAESNTSARPPGDKGHRHEGAY